MPTKTVRIEATDADGNPVDATYEAPGETSASDFTPMIPEGDGKFRPGLRATRIPNPGTVVGEFVSTDDGGTALMVPVETDERVHACGFSPRRRGAKGAMRRCRTFGHNY
ncbi:MAG: hypothetical protein WCT24_01815 [Patescibacteria group bacterium]